MTTRRFIACLLTLGAIGGFVAGSAPPAEAAVPKVIVSYENTGKTSRTCTIHRDDNGNVVSTFSLSAHSKSQHRFEPPSDQPLLHMKCPAGPAGSPTKMSTKLDSKKADTQGWSVTCDNTGCRAVIKAIQKA